MDSVGAVVSVFGAGVGLGVGVGDGSGVTATRVTLTVWEALPVVSVAVIVMLFDPTTSGMFKAVQFPALIEAIPDEPALEDQETDALPLPPVTVPESATVDEVVLVGGAVTLNTSGGGGGGGVLADRAAYIVWMAAISSSARPETIL